MPRVYVSIGSNIDREHNIRSAVSMLRDQFGTVVLSGVYETEAVGFEGGAFYNLVAAFETDMPVDTLLEWLDDAENQHGRDRSEPRFGPRTLDMDLLLYGDLVDAGRHLPRDEVEHYAFVLGPLAEIAPGVPHPLSGIPISELWQAFDQDEQPLKPVPLMLSE